MNAMPCRVSQGPQLPEDVYHAYKDDDGTPASAYSDRVNDALVDLASDVDFVHEAIGESAALLNEIGIALIERVRLLGYTKTDGKIKELSDRIGERVMEQVTTYLSGIAENNTGYYK